MSKLLELAHKRLGWPSKEDIISPKGTGPRVIAELAKRKIETAIKRAKSDVNVGILTGNPISNKTEDPLAIVCDFPASVDNKILYETHRLAWSFSRSPMLITVEPNLLRVWTCWKRPEEEKENIGKLCVIKLEEDLFNKSSLSTQAAKSLQWVELTSGNFFKNPDYSKYFQRDQRADQLMLEDLRILREKLLAVDLSEDICHDLIARVIFIEFLFQRKDSQGNAALNAQILTNMYEEGVLKKQHKDLAGILGNHEDAYHFFRELNDRFNGDLFPGKGGTQEEREKEWKQEMQNVKMKPHLRLLADFVSGKMEISTGQYCLWQRYAFDAIPLEFVSSIYEEFLSKKKDKKALGVHYTPAHIVDFILDAVLPWNSKEWNVKILDPACGSGIFLVKSYQRLIHRWKNAHKSEEKLTPQDLRGLLEKNLFGTDINGHAIRVASFSLYLAMCDEIEPKFIWQQKVKFPRLRDRRLIESDFFREDKEGFRTEQDKETYDIVLGNAPWGHRTETEYARTWTVNYKWPISNKDIGMLFPCKSAILTKPTGRIALLQPAGALLFNRNSTAIRFRQRFFRTFSVERIVNLSSLRFGLFRHAISPACIIIMNSIPPSNEPMIYICPKSKRTKEDEYSIVIEPSDVNYVYPDEAIEENLVWTSLAWGGRRDLSLMRKLSHQKSLKDFKDEGLMKTRRGIGRGQREERQNEILDMPLFDRDDFPKDAFIHIDASSLPRNKDPWVYAGHSKSMEAFKLPQMLVKLTWRKGNKRFRAVLVKSNPEVGAVLPSASYMSVHIPQNEYELLRSACLGFNSTMAVYYMLLSSGRFAFFIPSANQDDLLRVPIPTCRFEVVNKIKTFEEIDEEVKKAFNLNDAESVLVEDLCDYTLPDFVGGINSPGRKNTRNEGREGILEAYCQYFIRVLEAGFGKEKKVSATIFAEDNESQLPVRLVAVHLDAPERPFIRAEKIDSVELIERLQTLNETYLKYEEEKTRGSIFYQRVARVYDTINIDGKKVPTVFIIKPDQVRYWTRSMAMRDADEIASDIMVWQETSEGTYVRGGK